MLQIMSTDGFQVWVYATYPFSISGLGTAHHVASLLLNWATTCISIMVARFGDEHGRGGVEPKFHRR